MLGDAFSSFVVGDLALTLAGAAQKRVCPISVHTSSKSHLTVLEIDLQAASEEEFQDDTAS